MDGKSGGLCRYSRHLDIAAVLYWPDWGGFFAVTTSENIFQVVIYFGKGVGQGRDKEETGT